MNPTKRVRLWILNSEGSYLSCIENPDPDSIRDVVDTMLEFDELAPFVAELVDACLAKVDWNELSREFADRG